MEALRTLIDYDAKQIYTLDAKGNRIGVMTMGDDVRGRLFGQGSIPVEQVAALVEEMTSRMYDQMKARTLTVLESLCGYDKSQPMTQPMSNTPPGRLIGYALDDAKRVAMDVLERRAPEITPEMLAKAGEERQRAEEEASIKSLTAACHLTEGRLWDMKQKLDRLLKEREAEDLVRTARMMGPGATERVRKALSEMRIGFETGKTSG